VTYTDCMWEKNFVARLGGQSELGAAVSRKAMWWDLRLASLLTHLLNVWSSVISIEWVNL